MSSPSGNGQTTKPPSRERIYLDIQTLEDARSEFERKANNANTQYIIAVVGVIAGLLILVLTGIYWLGGLIFVAGALAVFTQSSKMRWAQKQIQSMNDQIRERREYLAGLGE